jgi:lipopolysaccharide transport system ATP-binding protein
MQPIIKIENLSKQYQLGNIGTGTLRNDIKRWWHRIKGNEDPFLKIGEINDRSVKSKYDYVWALKDINLEIMTGEVIGIIGKNGAGKSTLLKILSKVTGPTSGKIHFNGRIGSLLEVGTGFHPELTGRENIFLNGAILGMTKQEIRRKLDEIIDFSGCERYIDTPVKRYSSGMTVRLGFAVAAHLEPEILVIDEVLAVGDAEFQKKAIGKMQDVSKNEGRTVLFVSHNMGAVGRLCKTGVLLDNGSIKTKGTINEVIHDYLSDKSSIEAEYHNNSDKRITLKKALLKNSFGEVSGIYKASENMYMEFLVQNDPFESNVRLNIGIWGMMDNLIMIDRFSLNKGNDSFQGCINTEQLLPGKYRISASLDIYNKRIIELIPDCMSFEVINLGVKASHFGDSENGIVNSVIKWNYNTI